ncbi:hypothetical protein [uncultured Roseobacter sp.]|uniref:hypothetical protein n=1 Tax=uncultured Roseobacter sp. TaxID=114847 RepID=UPI00260D1F81|nr:hypothetical protein [uncultured Roseobacter sp.]
MSLSTQEFKALRHPSEAFRFTLTLFVLVPAVIIGSVIVMATSGIALIVIPTVIVTLWFAVRLFAANHLNNSIECSEQNFPEVIRAVQDAKEYFGYKGEVIAFVVDEGDFNAKLVMLLRRKYLMINAGILSEPDSDAQMRFVVGRFVGALATKKYRFMWLQAVLSSVERLMIFNLLLYPYERSTQLSGDQMGLAMINGNLDAALNAMMRMTVGNSLANRVSIEGFVEQGQRHGHGFFSWLVRALSTFPHNTKRVENLIEFAEVLEARQTVVRTPQHVAQGDKTLMPLPA